MKQLNLKSRSIDFFFLKRQVASFKGQTSFVNFQNFIFKICKQKEKLIKMPAEQAIDMLNETLAEIVFRTKNVNKFKRLARSTHFNYREVEGQKFTVTNFLLCIPFNSIYFSTALAIIHRKCVQIMGPISRILFRDLFHAGFDFTENIRHILVDKMFSVIDKRNALQVTSIL